MRSEKVFTVQGVKFDEKSGWPIVILQSPGNGNCFGIAISALNVFPVLIATDPEKWPDCGSRPVTHDFALALAGAGDLQVERLVIDCLTTDGVFVAALEVRSSGGEIERVDARPSDAIPVALAADAPIFVTDDVVSRVNFYPFDGLPYRDIEPEDVPGL